MQNVNLTKGTRRTIKIAICAILIAQVLGNICLWYLKAGPGNMRIDPRLIFLILPGMIYLMCTNVPYVLESSEGIKRQAIHYANWALAFGIWQFLAPIGQSALVALFAVGVVIMVLSVKDAIRVEA